MRQPRTLSLPMEVTRGSRYATAIIFFIVASVSTSLGQSSAITAPRSVAYLTERAGTIVHGSVIRARMEKHPQFSHLNTVVVTLRVKETLKGRAGQTFTFRQYTGGMRDNFGRAEYRKGEELLLLLNPPSRYGLSSPVGLEQGRFRILRDGKGSELAVNGNGNTALFRGMEEKVRAVSLSAQATRLVKQHQQGPVPLRDLREIIIQLTHSAK